MSAQATKQSIEHYGLGQSGYAAGRVEGDPALRLEGRNTTYPRGTDEHVLERGLDDRFTGCGGPPWAPTTAGIEDAARDDKRSPRRHSP
jgi:hypothetical protein